MTANEATSERTHIAEVPWRIAGADDKKRARRNCIRRLEAGAVQGGRA